MSNLRIVLLVMGVALISQASAPPQVMGQVQVEARGVQCNGKYKGGLKPSPAELAEIFKKHDEWLKEGGGSDSKLVYDPRRGNLCGADLTGAFLSGMDLEGVDLEGVGLEGAELEEAHLEGADMTGAHLKGADLGYAHLEGVDLEGAHLEDADLIGAHLNKAVLIGGDLTGADLFDAELKGADLGYADLEGVDLTGAHLTGANLGGANLGGADLEFDLDSPPNAIPAAENLQLVTFREQPAGLVKLRGEFKNMGLRTQESQLTYAIRRSELSRKDANGRHVHSWSERAMNTMFFDWTCQYGMSPGRPLLIVASLAAILSIVYIFAQVDPGPNGGIWAVWDEHRIKQGEGSKEPQQLTDGFPSGRSQISFLVLAFYFSLLSATRIGWHELNVGTWITRIQPREYTLRATGWVRVVSGVQSLISVYLVALAILTYFATPFEY
jgi:uncharacterized protein YjbI with pentapeptide repeats